jgi:hypothetical protein
VSAGTLSLSSTSLGDAAHVSLATGTTLNLNFSGTDTIDELYLNGVRQVAGSSGSLTSTAAHKTSQITGTGILSVTSGPTTAYDTWTSTHGLTGADADPDNDGIANSLEFVFGTALDTISVQVPVGTHTRMFTRIRAGED